MILKRSKKSERRTIRHDCGGYNTFRATGSVAGISGVFHVCGMGVPCVCTSDAWKYRDQSSVPSVLPVPECGAASGAKDYQGWGAHLPTIKTRLCRNRSTETLLKYAAHCERYGGCVCQNFNCFWISNIRVWLLTNIAQAKEIFHETGHHISDKRQPARIIDQGRRAEIVP